MSGPYVLQRLLDRLWDQYKARVPFAAQYQRMVEERGGKVQNDHIAFRTFNAPAGQPAGVEGIARVFTALGYKQKDKYLFPDKKLTAWHYEHARDPKNPKIFISQMEVEEFKAHIAAKIKNTISKAPDLLSAQDKEQLKLLATGKELPRDEAEALAERLVKFFSRPWGPPARAIVEEINKDSQYGAWTLLHGNSVNHFTAYINEQNVKEWPDIEATVYALRAAGMPMKAEFEGARGSKLRQSSTVAAEDMCDVVEADGSIGKMNWSYAYYELAERGNVPGPDGKPVRFQAFLGAQATNLFDMTKRS